MKFTQYLMPDGRQKEVTIDRSPEIEELADKVIEGGGKFEAEMLAVCSGPNVSFTCHYKDEDVAIELVENGPKVMAAVDRLVHEAYRVVVEGGSYE